MELIAGSACSSLRFVDRKPRAVCSLSSSLYNHNVWPIFDLFLYYVLLPLSSLHSFSSKLTSQKTGNMSNNISAFVDGLSLPSSQAQSLTSKLESGSNLAAYLNGGTYLQSALVPHACYILQACLGTGSVDTAPVSQTEVDANWSAVLSPQSHRKLTIVIQVRSMLEYSNMCRTPRVRTKCIKYAQDCQFLPNQIRRPQWRPFPKSGLVQHRPERSSYRPAEA